MLEGIDRVVDLIGPRFAGFSGADEGSVVDAVRRCDGGVLAATDGHFAATAVEGRTVRLARTIGLPLRYFVAKMYHGPFLVVSDRMDRLFDWCCEQRIAWQFDPAYTRMVPAHFVVELDQVGCPDPAPRYHRFFEPAVGEGLADIAAAGAAYIQTACDAVERWVTHVPDGALVALAFSGGVDSTAVLLLARRAFERLGRDPSLVRPFSLDLGGGADAAQAQRSVAALGVEDTWERVAVSPERLDLEDAIGVIEDYHPLDVECAAAGLCLLRGIRERYPSLTYLLDGDGGDENLKAYPLEDSDLTLSSVLRNPLLYQEGWGVDAIKHSLVYSGGLSRSYVRTCAPAAAVGFQAFSPFTVRSVIASALAIPVDEVLAGHADRLATLKQDVIRAGVRSVLGIDMPVHPKRRFQDGASGTPRARATKAWCRSVFNGRWEAMLREADAVDRRSGNEMVAAGL
jgi:asparagine synthase (glutamine-hydrolysing)